MKLGIKYRPEVVKGALFRLFGILHLLFASWGVYLVVFALRAVMRSGHLYQFDPKIAYYSEAFIFRTTVNVILLAVEVVAALYLLRLSRTGLRLNNIFCLSLLVYESFGTFFGFGEGVGISLAASAGTGNMGIAPQFLTGYPVIAFVALNLAEQVGKPTSERTGQQKYSAGVVLISVWAFLLAALFTVGAAFFLPASERLLAIMMFSFGTVLALVGFGLLRRQEWARFTMVALAASLTWAGSSTAGYSSWEVPLSSAIFFLAIHVWMMWYLLLRWDVQTRHPVASGGGAG